MHPIELPIPIPPLIPIVGIPIVGIIPGIPSIPQPKLLISTSLVVNIIAIPTSVSSYHPSDPSLFHSENSKNRLVDRSRHSAKE